MGKPGPARRPQLAIVREGNPGHHPAERLQGGVRLEARPPDEPDWRQWWPPVRVPTEAALQRRYPLRVLEGQLAHIEDPKKRRGLAKLRQGWLIARDREQAARAQAANRRGRDVARAEWRRVVPILAAQRLLAVVDAFVLTDYCRTVARLDQCEQNISELGLWVQGERGAQKNPATTVANQLRGQLRFYVSELGLTPPARDAMPAPEAADDDDDPYD